MKESGDAVISRIWGDDAIKKPKRLSGGSAIDYYFS